MATKCRRVDACNYRSLFRGTISQNQRQIKNRLSEAIGASLNRPGGNITGVTVSLIQLSEAP